MKMLDTHTVNTHHLCSDINKRKHQDVVADMLFYYCDRTVRSNVPKDQRLIWGHTWDLVEFGVVNEVRPVPVDESAQRQAILPASPERENQGHVGINMELTNWNYVTENITVSVFFTHIQIKKHLYNLFQRFLHPIKNLTWHESSEHWHSCKGRSSSDTTAGALL